MYISTSAESRPDGETGMTSLMALEPPSGSVLYTQKPPTKIALFSGPGTRHWARYGLSELTTVRGIRSNCSSIVKIINISRGGILIGTLERLTPRTWLRFELKIADRYVRVLGYVLRSSIMWEYGIPSYSAALVFEKPLPSFDNRKEAECISSSSFFDMNPFFMDSFASDGNVAGEFDMDEDERIISSFLVAAHGARNEELFEMLKLNTW
ncbi:MAG: hypothetical protein P8Z37_08550 [Acidobacteriota bacterium]